MKRFTREGTEEQERQLIPAQSDAEEEEALLVPSFEGGVAGARTLSRRQALGLLGGSLAGVGLLSLGLAAPAGATTDFILPFRSGDHITLQWFGDTAPFSLRQATTTPTNTFLDGRLQDAP
jgi:hypothetical protein